MRADDHKVSKITSEAIFAVRPISPTKFILAFLICILLILIDSRYQTSKYVRGFAHDIIAPLYLIVEAPSRVLRKMIELRKSNQDLKKELEEYKKRLNNNDLKKNI